jgi:enoyl-CoA hydratase/carnithine racemase
MMDTYSGTFGGGNAAEDEAPLLIETRGPARILTLNRPRARNGLTLDLIAHLHRAIDGSADDSSVSAVIITGALPVFCAGHDLKEMTAHRADADKGRAFFDAAMNACSAMMLAITQCPKPVIAAVNGVASAAGCQLVAACDLAIADEHAVFITPGVDIGLFCSTPMVALSRAVPRKAAMKMLLTGEPVSAAEAKAIGLVNEVVPRGRAASAALSLAETIALKSPGALRIGKPAFYRQIELPLAEAYAYASAVMVENMMNADAEEGIGAFIDKRKPEWPA